MKTIVKKSLVCFIGIVAIAIFAFAVNASADYIETFSNDNANWLEVRTDGAGNQSSTGATWNGSDGNLPGCISGVLSSSSSNLLYGFQPTVLTPYGDLTGMTMTADFKTDGSVTGPEGAKVRFYVGGWSGGSNYYVSNDTYSWDPNGDTSWTTHQVALDAANFEVWPNQNAGSETFAQIIAAPDDIGLVFADGFTNNANLGFTGSGTISVDNFGTVVPEPGTLTLLSLAGLAMIWIRRRKSSG
ncbi:MAG: PEP-CTERM sorting domain-containing protein [Thermoguttaceae bacterium]|jgi:hypothetical protein